MTQDDLRKATDGADQENPTDYYVYALDRSKTPIQGLVFNGKDDVIDPHSNTTVVGGYQSNVVAGKAAVWAEDTNVELYSHNEVAIAGTESTATTYGQQGLAYVRGGEATCVGSGGVAITRAGHATGALLAVSMRGGKAVAKGSTIAIAMNQYGQWDAQAQASKGGLLIFGFGVIDDDGNPATRFISHTVTEAEHDQALVLYQNLTVGPPQKAIAEQRQGD